MVGFTPAAAADEDLSEATALPDHSSAAAAPQVSRVCSDFGYLKLQYNQWKPSQNAPVSGGTSVQDSFPNFSGMFAASCQVSPKFQLFLDGHGSFNDGDDHATGVFDQGGIRWRPKDDLVLVAGKERNRRSPGLIISPSDFVHTSQSLPGQDEQRNGEWLVRASHQTKDHTVDFIALAATESRTNGFPEEKTEPRGGLVRFFHQFSNMDLNLSAGKVDKSLRAGASTQGFILSSWRVYAEAGFDKERQFLIYDREYVSSYLIGTGYDGDKFTGRAEFYQNGAGLTATEYTNLTESIKRTPKAKRDEFSQQFSTPFLRKSYAILSLSLIEIKDIINITETMIRSTEDASWIALSRLELLAGSRNVVGLTVKNFDATKDSQYFARSTDWEASVDWKWSF